MRVPTRSAGTRSGVNCRRLKLPPSTSATVLTVSVLARPGTPSSSTCPPASRATRTRSSIASWPTITRLISNSAVSSASWASREGLGSWRESSAWSRRSSWVTAASPRWACGSSAVLGRLRLGTGSELDGQRTFLAAAHDHHFGLFPRLAGGNRGGDVLGGLDVLVVDLRDLVARLEAALGGGAVGDDRVHKRAGAVRRSAVAHAEVRALHLPAVLDQRGDELHGGDRDGEAHAGVGVARAADLAVDADHTAVAVQQRAARVAGVDRGVRLDGVGDRVAVRGVDRAAEAGDDARRDGALEAERRADRDRLVTRLERGRIAQLERLQAVLDGARVDFEDREV